jgi:hypothetical protein
MHRRVTRILTALVFLLTWAGSTGPAAEIPFPAALAQAAVDLTIAKPGNTKDNRAQSGLVVGNGDLNVIVSVAGPDLLLRVTKNDAWDGRIDTSGDPALPLIDPAAHTVRREGKGNPPSWEKPNPTAVASADIRLAGLPGDTEWHLHLDLATAVATVTTPAGVTSVRVLANNVIAVSGPRSASLLEIPQKFLPAVTSGRDLDGTSWLTQDIPGDADIRGMQVQLVCAGRGSEQRIAVVSSHDAPAPMAKARELVAASLATPAAELIRDHEARWAAFWAASGVELSDPQLQSWWYRMTYFFACFSRSGGTAAGLKACMDGLAGWHNSYKFNYNIQQTYAAAGCLNHPELSDPIIDVLSNYWPRARWLAATCFVGCEGAFVHSDVFHPHEPDPATCTTRNQHQFAYLPWGFTLGMQGHIAVLLWERHLYAPDRARLENRLYPLLKDIALFYCSFIEHCHRDVDGHAVVGPSYFPEDGYFGQDNVAYDLPYIAYGLTAARDAAVYLDTDPTLRQRITATLALLPGYETRPDPAQDGKPVVIWHKGAKFPDDDRHGSLIQAVFPASQITWRSPVADQELFRRTINLVGRITTHANSPVTLNIARARLGMTEEALNNIAIDFTRHHVPQPNGLFLWKAHGFYISEQVAVARMVSELLLQYETGIIRLFPAWPRDRDGAFAGLRTYGGFLVTARRHGGVIAPVVITATVGGTVRLLSPWPNASVRITRADGSPVASTMDADGIITCPTSAGESLTFQP